MLLEAEAMKPLERPSATKINAVLRSLRSYGPRSFASLTSSSGEYLQVAGGGQTCLLERWERAGGPHHRAFGMEKSKVFQDGALLTFSGGSIALQADEWIAIGLVSQVFIAFLEGKRFPEEVQWRKMPALM